MSILFACAGRTGASNDTAMGLGLMIPSIAPAKAANSCDAATTASAQPVVVYDPFIAMQADMLRMNTEMNRVMQAAFTAAPTDHMQTSYKDSKYTITVPRKASIEHTADKPEQGLCI
jgi:hypothetical protein